MATIFLTRHAQLYKTLCIVVVHLIIGIIWLGKDNAICFPLRIYMKYPKVRENQLCIQFVGIIHELPYKLLFASAHTVP